MSLCQAFETMLIRDALKHGCYELQKARDAWRVAVGPDGMDADLAQHYIEVQPTQTCHGLWSASFKGVQARFACLGLKNSVEEP